MNWIQEDKHLTKEFTFSNFTDAVNFVNNVVPLANKADHHPDVLIHSYKKVKILLTTHEKGKITDKDYALASEIDNI